MTNNSMMIESCLFVMAFLITREFLTWLSKGVSQESSVARLVL